MTEALLDEAGSIRRVLVAMMVADGDVDPEELATIRSVYGTMTGQLVDPEALEAEARAMMAAGMTLSACIHSMARELDVRGKRRVLAAAFSVATADGFVLDEEDELLSQVGRALGMDDAQYKTALHELMTGQFML
jgi:tellurite resistance protein